LPPFVALVDDPKYFCFSFFVFRSFFTKASCFPPDDDGIVVTVRKDAGSMAAVVRVLREKLGDEAMEGLQTFVNEAGRNWKDDVLALAAERFDRRLNEEIGAFRLETTKEFAAMRVEMAAMRSERGTEISTMGAELRSEMATMGAELRSEMATMGAELRSEMATMGAELRTEMGAMGAGLRTEIAAARFSMLMWAFVFWIGQFAAMSAMMTFLLRIYR
jgi:hypothetical protein